MKYTLKNVRPFVDGKILSTTNVIVQDDKIFAIGENIEGNIIDCNNQICCAGFIDIHTHGGWGKDCMEATYESLNTIAKYHLSTGITTFIPTTMTASPQDIDKALDNIRNYKGDGARVFGAHLEGPYLAKKSAGAHPPQYLIAPTEENQSFIWKNVDVAKRITLAPDLQGSSEFCKKACQNNIQISLGHDDSIDDEIMACVENGASSVTHMYNCTSKPSRRTTPKKHLGLTEMGLIEDRLMCEVIADDRHVPNKLFGMIYKIKGADNICLVSDSLSVAGMPQGDYFIGSGASAQAIRIEDGVAVLPNLNTYAGSITPISLMAKNLAKLGYDKNECLKMTTLNPAKLMKMTDRGNIKVGMLADFNLLDDQLDIKATYLGGKLIK